MRSELEVTLRCLAELSDRLLDCLAAHDYDGLGLYDTALDGLNGREHRMLIVLIRHVNIHHCQG